MRRPTTSRGTAVIQIINVDISEMDRALRDGRARSPETVQLVEAIESLGKGEAKGVAVTDDLPEKTIRARLAYAAKLTGRRLSIASDGEKVMFVLANGQRRRGRKRAT